jgi:hypothetical protein
MLALNGAVTSHPAFAQFNFFSVLHFFAVVAKVHSGTIGLIPFVLLLETVACITLVEKSVQ